MNTIGNLLKNLHNVLPRIYELLRYALTFIRAVLSPRAMLAARLLAAESQLAVCKQRILETKDPRPRFPASFRLLWVIISKSVDKWENLAQLREAMPFGFQPKYLFRDNDGIYSNGVQAFLESCGIEEVRTAYRSPWQNPFIERFIGTLRRELLDHVIVLCRGHLERLLREFIEEYYHVARPHQGLDGKTPIPHESPEISCPSKLISIPVVGGLHHRYIRVAA